MEIATALLKTGDLVFKFMGSPIYKEIQSIRKYKEEFRMLEETVDMIGDVLSDVEGNRFKEESVNKGYSRLRNAYLDAEDVVDKVRTLKKKHNAAGDGKLKKMSRFFSKSNPVVNAIKVKNSVEEIRKNLEAISQDLRNYGLKDSSIKSEPNLTIFRAKGAQIDVTTVIGREEDKRKILELLLSSSFDKSRIPVISIIGIGGLGKTTLAQLVYKSVKESKSFDMEFWVSDSKKFDSESLLKHILKYICSYKDGVDNLDEDHLRRLFDEKIHGKRFFLVLDDVDYKNVSVWEKLEALLNCGRKESRILVTTRSRKVAEVVGSSCSEYILQGLSEKDSLQLFEKYAYMGGRDRTFNEIGNTILHKCQGVPLALKVVGSLLDGKGRDEWKRFRDNILAEVLGQGNQLKVILKISYDELDRASKQCFSLCALFLKNKSFSKVRLSNIWKYNVRFEKRKGETPEDVLRILYNRGFLEVDTQMLKRWEDHTGFKLLWDDVEYFKMHDLMHDLAKEVAGSEVLAVDSNECTLEEDVRHLSLMCETSTFHPKGRRIRTLILDPEYYQSKRNFDDIVSNCPVLRFLDIRFARVNLTNSIKDLIHLRCLFLICVHLETLPDSIGELINLRHLALTSCYNLTQLPSKMGALTSLEVLDLERCTELVKLPSDVESWISLRQLNLRNCYSLTNLPSKMGALRSLEVLDLSGCSELVKLPSGVENWISLRQLNLQGCFSLTILPSQMGALRSLEVLDLRGCSKLEKLPSDVENWISLRQLNLRGCLSMTNLPSEMSALTSLELLDLQLRNWTRKDIGGCSTSS